MDISIHQRSQEIHIPVITDAKFIHTYPWADLRGVTGNQTYDTCILKEKISGIRRGSNPQPSQLWCDALLVELPSPWEQDGGELGICIQV